MAEKPKEKKDDKKKKVHHSGGELNFGIEVLLFVVGIFIIWVLAGGAKKSTTEEKPFMTQPTNQITPNTGYGPINN